MHSRYWPSSRTRKLNSRILRTFFQCNLGMLCHYCQTSNILQYTTSIYTLCITHYELESEIVLYFTLCASIFVFRTFHSLFFHIFFQTSFSSTKMACPMIKHHLFNSFFVLKFFFCNYHTLFTQKLMFTNVERFLFACVCESIAPHLSSARMPFPKC